MSVNNCVCQGSKTASVILPAIMSALRVFIANLAVLYRHTLGTLEKCC